MSQEKSKKAIYFITYKENESRHDISQADNKNEKELKEKNKKNKSQIIFKIDPEPRNDYNNEIKNNQILPHNKGQIIFSKLNNLYN